MKNVFLLCAAIFLSMSAQAEEIREKDKLAPINHIIVIYLENHSFDNLFGTFPGADGLTGLPHTQMQADGTPYKTLPPVKSDKRFPKDIPNMPFRIENYAGYDEAVPDPVHRFYQTQFQIHNGTMDRFVQHTNVGALVMGYYEQPESALWKYAKQYTLADNFFTAAFGGSLINHFWLVCACTPRYENAPAMMLAQLHEDGSLKKDGELSPDGYLINNIQPFSAPYDMKKAPITRMRLPALTQPTIGDRLTENDISWAWYAGGWNEGLKGKIGDKHFIPHHHPFLYFQKYDEGTEARARHLKDEADFLEAIEKGTLPAVSFYKPEGRFDLHPSYSTLKESEDYVFGIIGKIEKSPQWKDTLIIVTFDDSGGFYDHVAPPKRDRFGPGIRVPTLVISPFAKKGFIDKTVYDSTSILKLIEKKFDLAPLNDAYADAKDLTNTLE